MENNQSIHIKNFNEKVKVMNQKRSKDLTLTAIEAQNLLSEIVNLLAQNSELANKMLAKAEESGDITVSFDGGNFGD